MNVREIMVEWLKSKGYHGLCTDGCGCSLNDLGPCEDYVMECVPGYRWIADEKDAEEMDVRVGDPMIKEAKP